MLAKLIMTVAEISITASAAIVLLTLASPFIKRHFQAKWRYIIWLVLSIRLIIPLNISLPDPPINLTIHSDTTAVRTADGIVNVAQPVQITEKQTQDIIQPDPVHNYSLIEVLAYVWLIGMVNYTLYQFVAYMSYKKKIKRQSDRTANDKILSLLDKLCLELSIKKKPDIWRCNNACSPMMFGFIKPALFLPSGSYDDYDLEVILRHELVHYKRRDLWYKLILLFANAVHWFNPLVYVMVKMACEDIEFSCDDEVVRNADIDFRKRYSQAILHSMHKERLQNTALSTHFKGGKKAMKNRFSNILDTTKKRKGIVALGVVAVLVFAGGMLVACNQTKQISTLKIEAGEGGTIPAGQETEITGDYEEGSTISIIAREMPDYYFVNWTSSSGGTFADANDPQTTFVMPGKDTIVTAHFRPMGNTENQNITQLEKISSEIADIDSHDGYKTENDFLYSPEGLQFCKTAYGAAKAMLSADAEELAQYLIDPAYATRAVRNLTNIFDDLAVMTLKFSLENSVISDDEIRTSYEYLLKGDDSYTYVSMTLLRVDGEWKVSEIGLEK